MPAPPAVPALPDTERRIAYTLSSSIGPMAVTFAVYGDGTDYQDWVEVWLNSVQVQYNDVTFGWALTSPTGPLGSIPRPITDGSISFNNAQTGTVQIVGARRPRRLTQFTESTGIPARDQNQTLTDIIADQRETWDRTRNRMMAVPAGETIGQLPAAAARATNFLAFDVAGNPVMATPAGGGAVNEAANTVLAGPVSGSPAIATFRNLVAADLPLSANFLPVINVKVPPYNAVGDGVADDTTAIQNAINACPPTGAIVLFPAGNYLISATLTIGNGTTSSYSTVFGIVLMGQGFGAYGATAPIATFSSVRLTAKSGFTGPMVNLQGTLQGWGVQNLTFDGGPSAAVGLQLMSANNGRCENVGFTNCSKSIVSTTNSANLGPVQFGNSWHNTYRNISILVNNTAGYVGLVLTGMAPPNNSCYNEFNNFLINFVGGSAAVTGILLRWCDSNKFYNTEFAANTGGGAPNATCIVFDYTGAIADGGANASPGANSFAFLETQPNIGAGGGIQFANIGTPALTSANFRPNYLVVLTEDNLATQPNIPGLYYTPLNFPATETTAHYTAGFTNKQLIPYVLAANYNLVRVNYVISVFATSAAGTVGLVFRWFDQQSGGFTQTITTPTVNVATQTSTVAGSALLVAQTGGVGSPPVYDLVFTGISGSPTVSIIVNCERVGLN
jgi:hypothetical protein